MDQSEIKLIHFDSAYFLPHPTPLLHIVTSDKDASFNREKIYLLLKLFRGHTNRDELKAVIKTVANSCYVCNIDLAGINEVLSHIFSPPHMDKCVKKKGLISSSGFAFWMRLLKMFPKNGKQVSKERKQQELHLLSSTLDLHSRPSHLTVEVTSADEFASALCNFIYASFAKSQRVCMFVKDKLEADSMQKFVRVNLPEASVSEESRSLNEQDTLLTLLIEGPNGRKLKHCCDPVIYLRPPVGRMKWLDPLTFCTAYNLCCPRLQSSLMLINSSEEKTTFRAFENRFMQSGESRSLMILPVIALEQYHEAARIEAATKNDEDGSTTVSPTVHQSTSTVPREETITEPVDTQTRPTHSTKTVKKTGGKEKRDFIVLNDAIPNPKSTANTLSIDDSEVKKWPTIFSPFDEEEGKAVVELIERMTDYC